MTPAEGKSPASPVETPQRAFEGAKGGNSDNGPVEGKHCFGTGEAAPAGGAGEEIRYAPGWTLRQRRNSRRLKMSRRMNCPSAAM